MPKVDFYTLKGNAPEDRNFFACRLVEKAFNLGHRIYLHVDSETPAEELDDLLWSFRPESFLPHAIDGVAEDDEEVPIVIGFKSDYAGPKDVLINLSGDIPSFHGDFQRIVEIVIDHEAVKQQCRAHWKEYQRLGYQVTNHAV